ncbi:MAG TPA: hypothetical protein VH416_05520 [Gaiellaceae bacterium]|jgi:hypothetical protein
MSELEPPRQAEDLAGAQQRRNRLFRRARLVVLALVIGYFFLPYGVQVWIPVWLPFAAAVGLEAQFFLGGLRAGRSSEGAAGAPNRGPQPRDLAELGGPAWWDEEDDDGEIVDEQVDEPARTPARRPFLRHLVEALVALAVVGGILFYAVRPHGWSAVSTANRARAEAVFSREASRIAGHSARVTCDTSGHHVGLVQEADGVAQVGGTQAYLTPALCDALYQLAFKHRVQSFPRTARAIAVLAHESWHLRGVADEGLANCYAFQSGVGVGVDLGLSESRARAMMREQLATNGADSEGNPQYLVPAGCRDGGAYDLHPGSTAFP